MSCCCKNVKSNSYASDSDSSKHNCHVVSRDSKFNVLSQKTYIGPISCDNISANKSLITDKTDEVGSHCDCGSHGLDWINSVQLPSKWVNNSLKLNKPVKLKRLAKHLFK